MPIGASRGVVRSDKMPKITIIAEGAASYDGALGESVQADYLLPIGTVLTCYCGLQMGWGGPGNLTAVAGANGAIGVRANVAGCLASSQTVSAATPVLPTATAAGDLLFAWVKVDDKTLFTTQAPNGWRKISSQTISNYIWELWIKRVTAADVTAGNAGGWTKKRAPNGPLYGTSYNSSEIDVIYFAVYTTTSGACVDYDAIAWNGPTNTAPGYTGPTVTPTRATAGKILSIWNAHGNTAAAWTAPAAQTAVSGASYTGNQGGWLLSVEDYTSTATSTARTATLASSGYAANGWTIHVYERCIGGGASSVWWNSTNQITAGGGGGGGWPGYFGNQGALSTSGGTGSFGGNGGAGGQGGAPGPNGGLGGGGYTRGSTGSAGTGYGGGGGGGGGGQAASTAATSTAGGSGGSGGAAGGGSAAAGSSGSAGSNGLNIQATGGSNGAGGAGGAGSVGGATGDTGTTPPASTTPNTGYYTYTEASGGGPGGQGGQGGPGGNGGQGANFTGTGTSVTTTSQSRAGDGRIRIYKNGVLVQTLNASGQASQTYTVV